ncbi:hypothetical protein CASFOL_009902 [Castilleja foliolosa]|uniref:Protein TIFY n=1 Tax=Castilleja foliolosa TaxID=1961234 RepID=A0ABD3DSW5_9LAMI
MERDFLGLNFKDPIVLKEECVDGGIENSGLARSLGAAWPWLNKPSHSMSFEDDRDEKFLNPKSDLLASHAYIAKPGPDMFEAMHKRQSGDIIQQSGPLADHIHDMSMMSSFRKPNFPNFGGANNNIMKQQFFGGPSAEQWNNKDNNNCKGPSSPTQLTIFYDGTVNVFDDITPEKAQAIIFLAGKGCVSPSKLQIPSSMSDSCFSVDHFGKNDIMSLSMTAGMSTSKVEPPPRMILPIRSVAASDMMSSAVPQARKASLSRFLEKRKESRATNAAPYNQNKNGANDTTQGSNNFGFPTSSGV